MNLEELNAAVPLKQGWTWAVMQPTDQMVLLDESLCIHAVISPLGSSIHECRMIAESHGALAPRTDVKPERRMPVFHFREPEHPGMTVLRRLLVSMRSERSDGYHDVGPNGKFAGTANLISKGLPQATPEDLDALFDLVGVVPDVIAPNGDCADCIHGRVNPPVSDGRTHHARGWWRPCSSCTHPKRDRFDPGGPEGRVDATPRNPGGGSCACALCVAGANS